MEIYLITNKINGKKYVGQTIHTHLERWDGHCRSKDETSIISKAIQKYGKDNFSIELLETCKSLDDLNESEKKWIKYHNTIRPNGYNIREGGSGGGMLSEETKEKLRQINLNRPQEVLKRMQDGYKKRGNQWRQNLRSAAKRRKNITSQKFIQAGIEYLKNNPELRVHKGSTNGRAKLTDEQVKEIKNIYSKGKMSQTKIALMFGVSQSTIGCIVNNKKWTHVP